MGKQKVVIKRSELKEYKARGYKPSHDSPRTVGLGWNCVPDSALDALVVVEIEQ